MTIKLIYRNIKWTQQTIRMELQCVEILKENIPDNTLQIKNSSEYDQCMRHLKLLENDILFRQNLLEERIDEIRKMSQSNATIIEEFGYGLNELME